MRLKNQAITLTNQSPIFTLDISPDGEKLVIGQQGDYCGNANLTLWSIKEKQLLAEIEHIQETSIKSARFTADGKTLVYVKSQEGISVYNIETQKHLEIFLNTAHTEWLAPAKKSHRLVAAGIVTEVWDTKNWKRRWTMNEYVALWGLNLRPAVADITPDGTKVAVAGKDINQVHIYDIDQNIIIQTLEEAPKQAHWARFSLDLRYFAVIGQYFNGIFIWNLETGERHLPDVFNSECVTYSSLCFHPNGKYLAAGMEGGYIDIFRLSDGEIVVSEDVETGQVEDLVFTPDGKSLFSGGYKGVLSILELNQLGES